MGIVIGVMNKKGGVGKTTTAVNVAAGLAQLGKKTLLIDFDPQGNATSSFGIPKKTLNVSAYDVLIGECRPQEAIISTRYKNVDIIPAMSNLSDGELQLSQFEKRNHQLKKAVVQVKDTYDVIIIDCLPSLGLLAINAMVACDQVIVPTPCEYLSIEGLAQILQIIKKIKRAANKDINLMGIVFTMTDKRLLSGSELKRDIKKNIPAESIFKTEIPRNVKVSEAPSHGEPVIIYDPASKGAEAYKKLTKEIFAKLKLLEDQDVKKTST